MAFGVANTLCPYCVYHTIMTLCFSLDLIFSLPPFLLSAVPQVIRKIRPEVLDASGHLKLWCQFFNVVSDSTIKWYKDEVEIAEIKRRYTILKVLLTSKWYSVPIICYTLK